MGNGGSVLLDAVNEHDLDKVQALILKGVDVNAKDVSVTKHLFTLTLINILCSLSPSPPPRGRPRVRPGLWSLCAIRPLQQPLPPKPATPSPIFPHH